MPVISLSLIPSRFDEAHLVLNSLIAQDIPNLKVEVYIPKRYRRFADYDGRLPNVPKGVEVCVVDEDLGPATKVLYAAEKYKNEATEIIFCDDDRIYFPNWARGFVETRAIRPDDAIVAAGFEFVQLGLPTYPGMRQPRAAKALRMFDFNRNLRRLAMSVKYGGSSKVPVEKKPPFKSVRQAGYVEIGEGFGGFMVKPQFFDTTMWEIPPVMWAVDDVWLSGHLDRKRKRIGIWAMAGDLRFRTSGLDMVDALHGAIIDGAGRGEANVACVKYMQATYGVWGGKAA